MPARIGAARLALLSSAASLLAPAVLAQPFNTVYAVIGDSRVAQSGGTSGVYGTTAQGVTKQITPASLDGFLGQFMSNRLRMGDYANFGIGGQTTEMVAAYPRAYYNTPVTWTGSVSGTALTISGFTNGSSANLVVGAGVSGGGLPDGTTLVSGSGNSWTLSNSATIAAGTAFTLVSWGASIDKIAALPVGVVFIQTGTNDTGTTTLLGPGGTGRTAIQQMIAGLTDPSYVYPGYGAPLPLYQGKPKLVVLLNETRRGVGFGGSSDISQNLAAANAAVFHDYAVNWVTKFDYASGDQLANPSVVVVNTFDDPSLANLGDTSTYYPLPYIFADGLHHSAISGWLIAQVIASRLNPILTTAANFARSPTTTTTGNFLNPNPTLTGSNGTFYGAGSTTNSCNGQSSTGSLTIPVLPASCRVVVNNGNNIAITATVNALGGNLGNEVVLRIQSTSSVAWQVQFDQLMAAAGLNAINLATQVTRYTVDTKWTVTSGTLLGVQPVYSLTKTSATKTVLCLGCGAVASSAYGGGTVHYQYFNNAGQDTSHADYKTSITPNMDFTALDTGNPTSGFAGVRVSGIAGTADITVSFRLPGVAVVTD